MKLYGVHHGGGFAFDDFQVGTMEMEPADGILEAIEGLQRSSVVGVEALSIEDVEASDLAFREEDWQYWQTIVEACEDSGHSVLYLDSAGIHKTAARMRHELASLQGALSEGTYKVAPGQERYLAEFQFALSANAQYQFEVAREDYILRKLIELAPDLAVIGQAHADVLMLTPELAGQAAVTEYWRTVLENPPYVDLARLAFLADRPITVFQNLEQSSPDPSHLREREHATRTYRAATLGRIVMDSEPQWIGSWEPENRPYGLFEVRAHTDSEGEIDDRLGTAFYHTAEFTEDKIVFIKEYDPKRVLEKHVAKGPVNYEAERISEEGDFEGVWRLDGTQVGGGFTIRRGNFLFEPPDIEFGQQKLF